MAILQGIAGMFYGDGAGGKIGLDIDRRVSHILAASKHSFQTATIPNIDGLRTGTIWFDRPEIIQNVAYDQVNSIGTNLDGSLMNGFDVPQVNHVPVQINKQRQTKYEFDDFDTSRIENMDYILGQISNGVAMAIDAQLNSDFLMFLVNYFKGTGKAQTTTLPELMKGDEPAAAFDINKGREELRKMKMVQAKLSKIYDENKLGVPESSFLTLISPEVRVNLEQCFWDQQGALPMILGREEYTKFGVVLTREDKMLQNNIAAKQSFSKDTALDTTNFGAIMLHTEAVGMPLNYRGTRALFNPINGNPRLISKYQYGIGFIRPELMWAFVATAIAKTVGAKG